MIKHDWQRDLVRREANRLSNAVRRWRWHLLARVRRQLASAVEEATRGVTPGHAAHVTARAVTRGRRA